MMSNNTSQGLNQRHTCPNCAKSYSRAFSLENHLRTHTGERPYACSRSTCGKTFATWDQCRTHEAIHTQNKTHVCSRCSKAFLRSCTLRRHERQVHSRHRAKKQDKDVESKTAPLNEPVDWHQPFPRRPHLPGLHPIFEGLSDIHRAVPQTTTVDEQHTLAVYSNSSLLGMPTQSMVDATLNPVVHFAEEPNYERTRSAIRGETSWPDLIASGPYHATWYEAAWFIAAGEGKASILRQLYHEGGVNINAREKSPFGTTALGISARLGHHDALAALLDLGANANVHGGYGKKTPLHEALTYQRKHCVFALLEKGSDVDLKDCDGVTPLMLAARSSAADITVFRAMLHKTRNINETDDRGWTLVHYVAAYSNCATLALALDHGANINARSCYGQTALHIASKYARHNNIRLILERSDLLNARDYRQRTALHLLGRSAKVAKVRDELMISLDLMLAGGADINALDNNGDTPLMTWLADAPLLDLEKFDRYGGDYNIINLRGETAMDIALKTLNRYIDDLKADDCADRAFWIEELQRQTTAIAALVASKAKTEKDLREEDSDEYSNSSEV